MSLVGITGTNGKTTVSTLTRHLFEEPGRPVGLIGTVQYNLGDRDVPSFRTTPEAIDLYPMLKSMLGSRLQKRSDGSEFSWDSSGTGKWYQSGNSDLYESDP